jgi:hypothetical protein
MTAGDCCVQTAVTVRPEIVTVGSRYILSQMNQIHAIPSYFFEVIFK